MTGAEEALAEIRRLADRFPVPHPSWHRHVEEMRAVLRDLAAALDAVERFPPAQEELLRQLDGVAEYPPDDAGGAAVAAARSRLRRLPIPEGEHPYLDEILVTLDAAEAALAALAAAGDRELLSSRLQS